MDVDTFAGGGGAASELVHVPVVDLFPGGMPVRPKVENPVADDPAAAERGMEYFSQMNCVGCHTPNGGGGMGPSHELTTNAVKYGGLSVPAGRIEVSWRHEGSGDARRLVLTWAEAGGPEARPPERRGFGCQLIERSVAHELDGMVQLEFLPGGVRCRLEIPL